MKDGAYETQTVPLLKGNLSFIWKPGWFHNNPQYDTGYEISFTILNAKGDTLFVSPATLNKGLMFT